MDQIFAEEKRNLDKMEATLDRLVKKAAPDLDKIQEQLDGFYVMDSTDYDQHRYLRGRLEQEKKAAAEYMGYKPQPYFGRIDCDVTGSDQTYTYYIGYKGLNENGRQLIIDWRAKLGEKFYTKETEFSIDRFKYSLQLRRALSISDGILRKYTTEFSKDEVTLQGEYIDAFLMQVLRDKRRQHRLTDIIQTIQNNQNRIIRLPLKDNFIVQGCAGSGKTMVLLHRLSYLLYNHRDLRIEGIRILTPSNDFNLHINDLTHELGIDRIRKQTAEDYYTDLLGRYNDGINVGNTPANEWLINQELVREIYSSEFVDRIRIFYQQLWTSVLNRFKEMAAIGSRESSLLQSMNYGAFTSCRNLLDRIISTVRQAEEDYVTYGRDIEKQLAAIDAGEKDIAAAEDLLEVRRGELRSELDAWLEKAASNIVELDKMIDDSNEEIKTYEDTERRLSEEITDLTAILEARDRVGEYTDYEVLLERDDAAAKRIRFDNRDLIAYIAEQTERLKGMPFYNFRKRQLIRQDIEYSRKTLADHIERMFHDIIETADSEQKRIQTNLDSIGGQLEEAKIVNGIHRKNKKNLEERIKVISKIQNTISIDRNARIDDLIGKNAELYTEIRSIMIYENARTTVIRAVNVQKGHQRRLDESREKYNAASFNRVAPEVLQQYENARSILEELSFDSIYNGIINRILQPVYIRYNTEYKPSTRYRHKQYVALLICSLYYGQLSRPDTLLCIDEAQDYAPSEIKLLQTVHGGRCTFNLYGDVNQLLYDSRGIEEWKKIEGVFLGKPYELNENYRNTTQITEYCNKVFEANVFPIGINGRKVIKDQLISAVRRLGEMQKDLEVERAAILYHRGNGTAERQIRQAVTQVYLENKKAPVIMTTDRAKGLEFDAVIAVTYGMDSSEQYLAYTRALDNLFIIEENPKAAV